ncbi:MAG: nickel pincer cofactor biosynthesis protein LarC [Proteobacteria bacterium]|nr:nickel pincer cofactor biosynthesis protein LarC [Pseudomonadota bacterium]
MTSFAKPPGECASQLDAGAGPNCMLFLDAFSGVSGDMLVAALLDLGVPLQLVQRALEPLPLGGYRIELSEVRRSSIRALRFRVVVEPAQPSRDYASIRDVLQGTSSLTDGARAMALESFACLARAEARVHGVELERVHFHEVGAVDSIVDIVAAAVCIDHLSARVACSPLPMGRGFVATQHGSLPLPAPATLECLRAVPTYDAGIEAELVTPTGACLVATLATSFERWPAIVPERVGWGAGSRALDDRPNALRAVLGKPGPAASDRQRECVLVETNVDDISGEHVAFALQRVLEQGAVDAWASPIGMKKGRPGVLLSALVRRSQLHAVSHTLLSETGSLGVRSRAVDRIERPRRSVEVTTPYGRVTVKIADRDGLPAQIKPEYEACQRLASAKDIPIRQVYQAALASALEVTRRR